MYYIQYDMYIQMIPLFATDTDSNIYEIFYFIISFICSWAASFVVFIFLAGESLGPLTLSIVEFRFRGVYVNS